MVAARTKGFYHPRTGRPPLAGAHPGRRTQRIHFPGYPSDGVGQGLDTAFLRRSLCPVRRLTMGVLPYQSRGTEHDGRFEHALPGAGLRPRDAYLHPHQSIQQPSGVSPLTAGRVAGAADPPVHPQSSRKGIRGGLRGGNKLAGRARPAIPPVADSAGRVRQPQRQDPQDARGRKAHGCCARLSVGPPTPDPGRCERLERVCP